MAVRARCRGFAVARSDTTGEGLEFPALLTGIAEVCLGL